MGKSDGVLNFTLHCRGERHIFVIFDCQIFVL